MASVNLGKVVGDSAYEVARKNGFVGTQSEWLASLKGPKGDKGDTGDSYVLTNADKTEIAEDVLDDLEEEIGIPFSDITDQLSENTTELQNARKSFTTNETLQNINDRIDVDINNLLQRIQNSTTIPYESEYIHAEDTYLGLTDNLKISGKTYQNLARLDLPTSELFRSQDTITVSNGIITCDTNANNYYFYNKSIYKPSTTYTIIFNVIKNTLVVDYNILYGSSIAVFSGITAIEASQTGIIKKIINSVSDLTGKTSVLNTKAQEDITEGEIQYTFQIYEGELSDEEVAELPTFVNGIESVEDVTIKSCGKNLFDASDNSVIINAFVDYSNNKIDAYPEARCILYHCLPNTTYTISKILSKRFIIAYIDSEYFNDIDCYGVVYDNNATSLSITTGENAKYIVAFVYSYASHVGETLSLQDVLNSVQIEIAEEPSAYEPYQSDSIAFEDIELRSLPDGTCDYIEGGNLVQCVGEVSFNGTESWRIMNPSENNPNNAVYLPMQNGSNIHSVSCYFDTCKTNEADVLFSTTSVLEGMWGTTSPSSILLYSNSVNGVAEFKEWLADNPTTVLYKLETPITTPIDFSQLKTYDNVTNVFSEESNVLPTISCRIPSDVGAVTSNVMQTNAMLVNDNANLNNTVNQQQAVIDNLMGV